LRTNPRSMLPMDADQALLVGRVWREGPAGGPSVVAVRGGQLVDITRHAPTVADLFERADLLEIVREAPGELLGDAAALLQAAMAGVPAPGSLRLLAPCDLQAIKAAGVTFAVSLLERVIEEQAKGNPARAAELRQQIQSCIGASLPDLRPGSEAAARLKLELVERGLWSQYMEVGIGPDAEVFTKSQPMSAVGHGAAVGLLPSSRWNNPEPEIVLAVNSQISRDPLELVAQTCGAYHQYPDGFMLFLGTMFSPIQDRDGAGTGFTHHLGDRVSISTPSLGTLVNLVQRCDQIPPWTFGVRALYRNLAQRGLLGPTHQRNDTTT